MKIAIGSESVPDRLLHARGAARKLPAAEEKAILANVRSKEPDVKGIVGKLTQGAVDAGFVYVTDVQRHRRQAEGDRAAGGARSPRSPTAPAWSRARSSPTPAQEFIDGLLDGAGADALAGGRLRLPPP